MNTEDFNTSVEAQVKRCTDILVEKADEYASDTDRLHNFKVAANLQGITVKEALSGMMAKHSTSVYDMMASGKNYTLEMWNEKIGDHINYLLLLRAIVDEEHQIQSTKLVVTQLETGKQVSLSSEEFDEFKSNIKFQGDNGAV